MREIRSLRAMWRALETGSLLKIYAPALDPTQPIPKRLTTLGEQIWEA